MPLRRFTGITVASLTPCFGRSCFAQDCARLTSTIVSNNAKVLRVYVNAGATIADTQYTYVKHLPASGS